MRHHELAHLLSNIEKLPLPILGSMFPFWNPTGVFLQSVAHVEKDKPSLFCCFPSIHLLRRQPRRRARGPRAPLARSTRADTAQRGSEDVDVRSRLRPDALPFRRFVFGQHCRLRARIRDTFARASACIDEMPLLYLLEMPSLYLLNQRMAFKC